MAYIPKIDELIEVRDDSEGALTCGVEIEFLVPCISCDAQDPDPDIKDQHLYKTSSVDQELIMKDVREQLLEILQQQLEDIPFRAMDDDDFYPPHDNVVIYDTWRLGRESTVSKHGGPRLIHGPYHWTDCELTSPVMDSDDYAQDIEDVCRVLKTVRIHLNKTTAVHVHVGRGDEPFSLLTLKKFATLYWLTEKAIIELQHPSRHNNKYNFRLNNCSVLANKLQATLDKEEKSSLGGASDTMAEYVPEAGLSRLRHAQLRRIWACNSMEKVAKLMQSARDKVPESRAAYKRGSVGFQRFLPAGKTGGNIQTFEWRQMSGSVDAKHINQWVKTCIAFTDFCRLSDGVTFKGLMENVIERGKKFTGIELLEALDVDTQIFKDMLEVWSQDSSFCEDLKGRKLFVPK
ncbi:putative amidoligase enzyme-domain-containing protein [Xylaria longipes]|nr:putative amidoligase enzyme-domain-containing protein [Xylaria longipes]